MKAFIVLSPAYSSQDPKKLTQELQEHVKSVTAPYKYPRKVNIGGSRTWWAEKSPDHTLCWLSSGPTRGGGEGMSVHITELFLQPFLPVFSLGPPKTTFCSYSKKWQKPDLGDGGWGRWCWISADKVMCPSSSRSGCCHLEKTMNQGSFPTKWQRVMTLSHRKSF